jgi:dihydroxyacid dehydratase/phosphogluconate dehydratase
MDARTDIKSTLPNMFEAVSKHLVGEISGADFEPATSLSATMCDAQFIASTVATVSEAIDPALPCPARALAVAPERDVKFDRFDAAEIFKKTPNVAVLKPLGRHVAKDMFKAGDIPLLMKTLLDKDHVHGDCFTVTGRTIAENLKSANWNPRQDVRRSTDEPVTTTRGMVGLKRNFAPDMAAVKVAGMSNLKFTGADPCFGDISEIDAALGTLNVKLTDAEQAERKTKWRLSATNHTSDTLSKFAQQVGRAAGGAVPRPGGAYEKQCHVDI